MGSKTGTRKVPQGQDLTDKRFGNLVVKELVGSDENLHRVWKCKCDCNKIVFVPTNLLTGRHTKSCGCFMKTAGMRKAKTKIKKTSIYKGVSLDKVRGNWRVETKFQGKRYFIGRFEDEKIAAKMYNAKAIELFGSNAYLNVID